MKHSWEYKKVGTLCDILNGFAFKSEKYCEKGTRVIRITNVQKGVILDEDPKFYPDSEMENLSHYCLRSGDLLMSLTGNVGRVGLLSSAFLPAALNQRVACLRIKFDGLNLQYLFHYFNSSIFEESAIFNAAGIAQKNMSTEWLKSYLIPVPALAVQERIVGELDKVREIIEKKKEQVKGLDSLAQSIFYDMFGDPVENEKGWEVKKLGEIGELSRGVSKHRPRNAPELLDGTMPLIQTGDVSNSGMYITEYHSTYSDLGVKQSRIWGKGTLCITIAANIGKCSILTFEACFPDSVVGFIPSKDTCTEYMYFVFGSIQKSLEDNAMGVAQKNINLGILNQISLALPPLTLQQAFAEKVETIEKQKELINQSIKEVRTLFDARMDYYFGEE